MNTILVTGASGIVGYGCLKAFRMSSSISKLIGTSIYSDYMPDLFCDVFELAVKTSDEHYLEWLDQIIKKHSVDFMIPGIEDDVYRWNEERSFFDVLGVKALLNSKELIDLCKDKWIFYNKFHSFFPQYSIKTLLAEEFSSLEESLKLPFIAKPRRGYGSKGIRKISNYGEYSELEEKSNYIFQEYLADDENEYTVGAFYDDSSQLCCYIVLRRRLGKQGFTECAEVINDTNMREILSDIGQVLKPIGPTNLQFRKKHNQYKLLEINPRISASASIRSAFNYNECRMSERFYLEGVKPVQPKIRCGTAKRYVEEMVRYDGNYF